MRGAHEKILDCLEKGILAVLIVLGTLMVIFGATQVFYRYVLKNSLPWTER